MLYEHTDVPVIELNKNDSDIPTVSGIYAYINEETGKLYIGKAINLKQRYRQHKYNKKAKLGHIDYELNKNPEQFDYRILIYGIDPSILESVEATYIQRYNATKIGYNIRDDKPKNINPDYESIFLEYNKLRNKYIKLYNDYVNLYEKYKNR